MHRHNTTNTQFQLFQDHLSLQDHHYHHKSQNSSRVRKYHNQPPGPHPSLKQCSTPHCQCPYSRPPYTKPSNLQSSPISGPLPTAEICLNKLLVHLVSLNGNPQTTTEHQDTAPLEPPLPTITSSLQSSSSSDPASESEAASTSSQSADTESTSSQSSISTASDRQL